MPFIPVLTVLPLLFYVLTCGYRDERHKVELVLWMCMAHWWWRNDAAASTYSLLCEQWIIALEYAWGYVVSHGMAYYCSYTSFLVVWLVEYDGILKNNEYVPGGHPAPQVSRRLWCTTFNVFDTLHTTVSSERNITTYVDEKEVSIRDVNWKAAKFGSLHWLQVD